MMGLTAALVAGSTVLAASHVNVEGAVKARQSHMQLYAFNIGILGNMAKGEVDFDAASAQAAADNLAALAKIDQSAYWPAGSSTEDGLEVKTRALPAIWESDSDIGTKITNLVEATEAMAADAATLEGVQANMRSLGGACGGCHEDYRQSDN
ncbi:cytochrome c [Psychromarinibacter sp. C21-152]|uniref:Cytochrome c n=2 Tax=Psychromarinibacter sediminicola TaxID=3033385 RepID=A0AAE3TAI4_9RHOB|nr:cytochrome c [Psychromarinibacter sediminicola]